MTRVLGERDVAAIARLFGDPARARILMALADAGMWAYADLAYQGGGAHIVVPFRRRPRRLSRNQRAVNRRGLFQKRTGVVGRRHEGPSYRFRQRPDQGGDEFHP